MRKLFLSMMLLGWAFCGLAQAQTANVHHGPTQEMNAPFGEMKTGKASTYKLEDGLVVDHQNNYLFNENSDLEQLDQSIFDELMKLDKGTIAIEVSTSNIPVASQVILSCGSSDNREFFGICTAENNHFGVKIGYENGSSIEEDYFSGEGLKSDFHQTILITMDPNGKDANRVIGSGGFGAYSFYTNGEWEWTTNVSEVPHFGIFKKVKHANAIYLGGVKDSEGKKKYGFVGTIHRIRVWNRILSGNECEDVTRKTYAGGNLLFESKNPDKHPNETIYPYRIPALAQAQNGNLIAVADHRICKNDIGHGEIDLKYRISKDNGLNWNEEKILADGTANVPYGDAAIVADKESSNVLVLCASGTKTYHDASERLKVLAFNSQDNGETWEKTPVDLTDQIYKLFPEGQAKTLFIASGRIAQSKLYKAGSAYRLYCVALVKNNSNQEYNAALYSDDFGKSWQLLGGSSVYSIPAGSEANEAKIEELPDGSVLVSSRISNKTGRNFNIFNYTDAEKAEGFWDKKATSDAANQGVASLGNSTNGDVLCIPVIRKKDKNPMYLLLQSLPYGKNNVQDHRSNISIYYKPLENLGNFNLSNHIAGNWEGRYEVTPDKSAYSVMIMQNNETLGFIYEDGNAVKDVKEGYNIFYLNFTIEHITDGKYCYDAHMNDTRRMDYIKANIDSKYELLKQEGRYVGQSNLNTPENRALVKEGIDAYISNPSNATYNGINLKIQKAINGNKTGEIVIEPGHVYRLINKAKSEDLIFGNNPTSETSDIAQISHYFTFEPTGNNNQAYYLKNLNAQNYLGQVTSSVTTSWGKDKITNPQANTATDITDAGQFVITSQADGTSTLESVGCTVDQNYKYVHLDNNKRQIVAWVNDADGSKWYIEPVDFSKLKLNIEKPGEYWSSLYLPYAISIPEGTTAYRASKIITANENTPSLSLSPITDKIVPAQTGVILKSNFATASLPIVYDIKNNIEENELQGTLSPRKVNYLEYYTLGSGSKGVGMYRPRRDKGSETEATIPANKAFYKPASKTASTCFLFSFEDPNTGIDEVETTPLQPEAQNNRPVVYYDLSGRRVLNPTHGIYIANGRKVYIK